MPDSGVAFVEMPRGSVQVQCTTASGVQGQSSLWTQEWQLGLMVRTDAAVYAPGTPVSVTVLMSEPSGTLFVDRVHRGRIAETWSFPAADEVTFETTPADDESGTIAFTAMHIGEDDQVRAAERLVFVQRPTANVSVSTDQETYLPGGEATLTFEVTDEAGQGKPAAIGVAIADEAVFALAGAQSPSDVAGHFLLDDAPSAVRPYAMATDLESIQLPAQAALASSPMGQGGQAFGLTKAQLENEARNAFHPPLAGLFDQLDQDLRESAAANRLKESNAASQLAAIELWDFWGRRVAITYEVRSNEWDGTHLRVWAKSSGPDEIADTWDDMQRSIWLEVRAADIDPFLGGGDTGTGDDGAGAGDWDDSDGLSEPGAAPPADPDATKDAEEEGGIKKRQDFPETLYVNPALITDGTGKATVTLEMADAITEWRVSMIANTAGGRIAGGQGGITVFQDFFVDADLPRKLTQNDELALPIGVFNFSDEEIPVTVTVTEAAWFELLEPPTKEVTMAPGQSVSVPFLVKVLDAGHHGLEVTATSTDFADGVIRTVQVLPDGQRIDTTVSGPLEGTVANSVTFDAEAITGGHDAFLKLMGSPGAQMVDGVDALLSAPRGCFEPMMNSTWINALVLDYLEWTGTENPGLKDTARANLDDGYQQCATFECTGGGFTWFGDPDPAHPILTGFALIMFDDIAQLRDVDAGLVSRAQEFLKGVQNEGGGWFGEHTKNESLPWDELRSTCVVARGLEASGYEDDAVLGSGLAFIQSALDLEADTYTLAMCANALLALDPTGDESQTVVAELLDRVQSVDEESGHVFWTSEYAGPTHAQGEVIDVETTALAAQALYQLEEPPVMVEGALKYLASKKSPDGNFLSTQGTIQAMRAFVAAAKFAAGDTDAQVTVTVGDQEVFSVAIDDSNREVVHLVSLTEHVVDGQDQDVTITAAGEGKLYYQLNGVQYVPWNPLTRPVGPLMDVGVSFDKTELAVGESTVMTVTVTSTGPADPGDMPMVDIGVPPGFEADLGPLDELVATDHNVARYELKGDRVVIYLMHLPEQPGTAFEVDVPLSPRFPMTVTTPSARAWSFYKPEEVSKSLPTLLTVN